MELVWAYHRVRSFTRREWELLPDLLLAHAAAEGIGVVSNWWSRGRRELTLADSESARRFLTLAGPQLPLHAALGSSRPVE